MSVGGMGDRKREVRRRMLARRVHQPVERRARASALIQRRLQQLPEYYLAQRIGLYLCLADEVDLDALVAAVLSAGRQVAVPAWRASRRDYGLREVGHPLRLETGRFGVREPSGGRWLPAAACDLMVVPGLAFDPRGARIGFGAGYYDRLLQDCPDTVCAGVAFGFQVVARLPQTPRDVTMQLVVTESGTIRCTR